MFDSSVTAMKTVGILAVLAVVVQLHNTNAAPKKVVCYFGSWANFRTGNGEFHAKDIDTSLCTHAIYTFVGLSTLGDVTVLDPWNDLPSGKNGFNKFLSLRALNPKLKLMVAVGGATEASSKYSVVMNNPTTRQKFINSVVTFVKDWGFDGFDLDWEYPAQHGGSPADKVNFSKLLQEMRARFDTEGLILSAAVSCAQFSVDTSYDIPALGKYLDFINVMAYDLHGAWDARTGQNAPLYASASETSEWAKQLNVDASIQHWIEGGAPASKIILGIGTYGRTFTLTNRANNGLEAPITGVGIQGPYTLTPGILGYNEICEDQKRGGWQVTWDDRQKVPFATKGDQWVGYDNIQSVKVKAEYARDMGLGGAMIWSLETDDFRGTCHGYTYPLLRTINDVLIAGANPAPTIVTSAPTTVTSAPTTVTPAPTTVTPAPTTVTPAPTTVTSAPTTVTPAPTTVTPAPTAPTSTAAPSGSVCTREGYVRDAVDCAAFYYCQLVNGSFYVSSFRCGDNLVFDSTVQVCNYRYAVNC